MSDGFPHLFVISQVVPHSKSAGPIQLMRLLRRWPADRLTVYGPPVPEGAETLGCRYYRFQPFMARLQFTRLAPLVPPFAALVPASGPDVAVNGPAVVLSVAEGSAYSRAARDFARRHRLRLALIVHDDPEAIEGVRPWARPFMQRVNGDVFRFARLRFCVSGPLRDALAVRYGAPAEVLHPMRSPHLRPRAPELTRNLRRGKGLVLGYAGALGYAYDHALAELLGEIRAAEATLRVYSLQQPWFVHEPGVEFAGPLASPEAVWKRVQEECDAVILPYYTGQNPGHRALYRTHFPSKLVEYLALGMPVIITGPDFAAGVQWGLSHAASCVTVPAGGVLRLTDVLRALAGNPDHRVALAQNAARAADEEFDPDDVERQFVASLSALANSA